MTDFAMYHCGRWKAGEGPNVTTRIYVVTYDQTSKAYAISDGDVGDFFDWVAMRWQLDNEPQGVDETAVDYLDRIGCSITDL